MQLFCLFYVLYIFQLYGGMAQIRYTDYLLPLTVKTAPKVYQPPPKTEFPLIFPSPYKKTFWRPSGDPLETLMRLIHIAPAYTLRMHCGRTALLSYSSPYLLFI